MGNISSMNQATNIQFEVVMRHFLMLMFCLSGCVASPYRFGRSQQSFEPIPCDPIQMHFDDRAHPTLDRVEYTLHNSIRNVRDFFGAENVPEEQLEYKRREAAELALIYLQQHSINDVYVEQRVYSPLTQWSRLRRNQAIHPVWKYTGGTLSLVSSTLLPARVLRRDTYNPFTQTLSLNSSDTTRSLLAASESRVYASSVAPGFRATSQFIPFVPIYHRTEVASEAISYAHQIGDPEFLESIYPRAYGYVGRKVATETIPFAVGAAGVPFYFMPPISLGGNIAGRSIGGVMHNQNRAASN
jgi:hypothetical protein